MPRTCTVCNSKHRAAVESGLVTGTPLRDLARRYHLTKDSISRHAKSCVAESIAKASGERQGELGNRLLAEMDELHLVTRALLKVATEEKTADPRIALRAIAEARRNLGLVARMVGRLDPKQDQDKKDGRLTTWEEFTTLFRERAGASKG